MRDARRFDDQMEYEARWAEDDEMPYSREDAACQLPRGRTCPICGEPMAPGSWRYCSDICADGARDDGTLNSCTWPE